MTITREKKKAKSIEPTVHELTLDGSWPYINPSMSFSIPKRKKNERQKAASNMQDK